MTPPPEVRQSRLIDRLLQGDTAVVAAHCGRRLGKCSQAGMVIWLLGDREVIQRFETVTNANTST
ncbi:MULTISPECIES: hypothetical protein [Actinosynnema]|uniref:hypothetical protein n=1 Tax=Actinosynnema TaxID=40566 RepID=UPI0020A5F6E6|nr:hypothetical protein [Actinosynnema pretiosum]